MEENGLQFPLVRSTVYRWMRQNGANYSIARKCHSTDRHDTAENIVYGNGSYIPLMDFSSRRMPEFVTVLLKNDNIMALKILVELYWSL